MEYLGSNLLNSVFVMIIGMVVVFIGLVVLIALTVLMSRVLKREKAEVAAKVEPSRRVEDVPPTEQIAAIAALSAVSMEADAQLVAVITAALMASEAAQDGKRLVVRSVRKAHSTSAWGSAGRQESVNY